MRWSQLLTEATQTLTAAHVVSPRVDAELLAAFVLGVARGRLAGAADPTPGQVIRYRELVHARSTRIPLQHLIGTAPFRYREVRVGPGVFVPRPETEQVVEWGLAWLGGLTAGVGAVVVDLCAGSGAIAASVASERRGTSVWAVEQDPAALEWLRGNVSGLGVHVVAGDVLDPDVLSELAGRVDLVLCNPPYVPEIGAAGLAAEVTQHDPHAAVFSGTDGLDLIRPLIGRIATLLRPGGAFAVEHDETHAYVLPNLVDADGRFTAITLHHDLARRPRFTTATRAGEPGAVAD